jgi:hypothetical protein
MPAEANAMSSWITGTLFYGLGMSAGRALFGDDRQRERAVRREPVRQQTEEEILADEKRYDAEARQLDADDAAARAARQPAHPSRRQGSRG